MLDQAFGGMSPLAGTSYYLYYRKPHHYKSEFLTSDNVMIILGNENIET